ncbi:MAG: zinc-binding dehydrogenase [Kiritimatiellia bacterium]
MIQQVMTAPGTIAFREVPDPVPKAGEVVVRIRRIGICGSDIHVWHGKHPFTAYPVTQGHEVAGEIAAVGAGVSGFSVGEKVTIEPQVVCGACHPCRHGKYNLCEQLKVMGFQTTGAASECLAVAAQKATRLPSAMSFDQGAMIEPLAVAVHAVRRFPDLQRAKVAVLGAGPIGNLVAQAAKGMGAAATLVTDVSELRLAKAQECGADAVANTAREDFGAALAKAFGPDKADVIFDCAGCDVSINQAIAHARKGSKIVLVAVFSGMAKVDLAVLNDHELDLDTSMMYRHEDYLGAIDLVNSGKVRLEPLVSKHFAFSEYAEAYRYIDANRESTLKVLIDVDR